VIVALAVLLLGCDAGGRELMQPEDETALADVIAVSVSGSDVAATIQSIETGCDQYADWWEVLTPEGALVYRRVLNHSHPDEQPFTRSGGPVEAEADAPLLVRAHMHPGGYGGAAVQGSLGGNWTAVSLAPDFAADLAQVDPLPDGCAF